MKRKVYIKLVKDTYHVFYLERKKYTKYSIAGFYAKDTTLEKVKNWIKNNPKLELVENDNGK